MIVLVIIVFEAIFCPQARCMINALSSKINLLQNTIYLKKGKEGETRVMHSKCENDYKTFF